VTAVERWLPWALAAAASWGIWGYVAGRARVEGTALQLVALVVAIEAVMLSPLLPSARRGLSWIVVATALAGVVAYVAFFQAFKHGGPAGAIVGVSALYPAVTLLLACVLDRHRPSGREVVGILLAIAAVVVLGSPGGAPRDASTTTVDSVREVP
jgi:bacterial/archaeal transporter family protein